MLQKQKKLEWSRDRELQMRVVELISACKLKYIKIDRVFCCRSRGAKTKAVARIWGFPRIWQEFLNLEPAYVLEVVEEKFTKLTIEEQDKTLLHELLHIPKNFSGALLSHRRRGGVNKNKVCQLYQMYEKYKEKIDR